MAELKAYKVNTLPVTLDSDAIYFVKDGSKCEIYVTDSSGHPIEAKSNTPDLDEVLTAGNTTGGVATFGGITLSELTFNTLASSPYLGVDSSGNVYANTSPINAATFNGQGPSYYLNYNNLTNRPAQYTLPIASVGQLGGIKIGTGLAIDVNGVASVTQSQSDWKTVVVYSSYTMSNTDSIVVVNNSAACTIYLPSLPEVGMLVCIVRVATPGVTIDGNGNSVTFKDSSPQTSFASAWSHWMVWDGTHWRRIADNT